MLEKKRSPVFDGIKVFLAAGPPEINLIRLDTRKKVKPLVIGNVYEVFQKYLQPTQRLFNGPLHASLLSAIGLNLIPFAY